MCQSSYNIGISENVYNNLIDNAKYVEEENFFWGKIKSDIWRRDYVTYNDKIEDYYKTNFHCEL